MVILLSGQDANEDSLSGDSDQKVNGGEKNR
jgi:hypothetical protein